MSRKGAACTEKQGRISFVKEEGSRALSLKKMKNTQFIVNVRYLAKLCFKRRIYVNSYVVTVNVHFESLTGLHQLTHDPLLKMY